MAVVFQETFVGAISFNYYAGPRILFNFTARIGFVVEDFPGYESRVIKPKHSLQSNSL
jgi:hypothetical protein